MKKIEKETEEQKENIVPLENAGRRKAVKTIVGGVTAVAAYNLLPSKWGIPIIEQVYLPAHAATSGTSLHDPCEVTILSGNQNTNSVVVRVNGYVTPPTANLPTQIIATPVGAGAAVTTNTTTAADGTFTADITLSGGPGITRVNAVTTVQGADGSASCGADVPQQAAANTAPTAADVTTSAHGQETFTLEMAPYIADAETADAGLTITVVSGPDHGALVWSGTEFTYTVTDGSFYIGDDAFTYRVTDPEGLTSTTRTVTLTDIVDF